MTFLLIILITIVSCADKDSESKIFFSECTSNVKKVSLAKLIYNPNRNDNGIVEVEGFYHLGFEKSILTPAISITNKKNSIWINLPKSGSLVMKGNPDSAWSQNHSSYMNGKKVKIIGKFVSFRGHHLEESSGEIDNICYIGIWD